MTHSDRQKIMSVALEIATEGHSGVFRNDKKTPYIEHPKAVAKLAVEAYLQDFPKKSWESEFTDKNVFHITVVSYFHDLIEDVEKWISKEYELLTYLEDRSGVKFGDGEKDFLVDSLKRMNKYNFPTYLEFVLSAKNKIPSKYAKIGDLTHNTSDLGKGSLKEKYILSLYIIKQ